MRALLALAALAVAGCAGTAQRAAPAAIDAPVQDATVAFPARAAQGALVFGRVPTGTTVRHRGRTLRVTPYGTVVFGIGRDETRPVRVELAFADGQRGEVEIAVDPRDWPVERIAGVAPETVDPPPAIAARIEREQAQVNAVRERDDARTDFAHPFAWPVAGRVSGRFGNQRVYNGAPRAPHSGMDIAAPTGTPVKAPAAGVVTFASPDLYLTGGTIVLDHGHGVSSNFLHLSRLDVRVGDRVAQGQVIGAVGATGRATGPHLHWGMNWFDVRVDPLLVLARDGSG